MKNKENRDSYKNLNSETAFTFMMLGTLDNWEQEVEIRENSNKNNQYKELTDIIKEYKKIKKNSKISKIFDVSNKNLLLFEFKVPNKKFKINFNSENKYINTQFDAVIFDFETKQIVGIESKLMSDDSGSGDKGTSQLIRNLEVLKYIVDKNKYYKKWKCKFFVICPKNLNTSYMCEIYKKNINYLFWDEVYKKIDNKELIDEFININSNVENNIRQLVVGKLFKFKEVRR